MKWLWVLLLCGCAHPTVKAPPPPDLLDGALEVYAAIRQALPTYIADKDLARFESAEIAAVQNDLAQCKKLDGDSTAFVLKIVILQNDWNVLVALDSRLQHESFL